MTWKVDSGESIQGVAIHVDIFLKNPNEFTHSK